MNAATLLAFQDELEKIKQAGVLSNIGTRILLSAKHAPRVLSGGKPGLLQGMANNAVKTLRAFKTPIESFKFGLKDTANALKHAPSWKGKIIPVMGIGFSTAGSAYELAKEEDPMGQGRTRLQRLPGVVGDQIGSIIAAPYGFTGGVIGGGVGRAAGNLAVKGVSKLRKTKKEVPQNPPQQVIPPEGAVSP